MHWPRVPAVARAACLWDRKVAVMSAPGPFNSNAAAFFDGVKSAWTSVFFLVLMGTYIGIGALAHDFGLSSWWLALSTLLVWAAPAQVILVSALGTGAAPVEVAIAVGLSAIRLFPMVVALLPLLRGPRTRQRELLLPTHFTSVSMWVESLRLLPGMPRVRRVAFCNGLSVGYMGTAATFGFVGYYLAAGLPPLFAGTLLFLTPMSFLISTANNCPQMVDLLARRPRPDVDRDRRRLACLRRPPPAPGRRMNAGMNAALAELWPYLLLILVGYLPNEMWRVLGLMLARGLNADSEIVVWSRAVATAILAGVIAKLILFSAGALAGIPLSVRIGAAVCGFLAFLAVKRSVFAGVLVGEAVLLLGGL